MGFLIVPAIVAVVGIVILGRWSLLAFEGRVIGRVAIKKAFLGWVVKIQVYEQFYTVKEWKVALWTPWLFAAKKFGLTLKSLYVYRAKAMKFDLKEL